LKYSFCLLSISYLVNGSLSYTHVATGKIGHVDFMPQYLTVYPQPHLSLDIFVPSFFPATTAQQPQPPSQIGVLLSNTGFGDIVDLTMISTETDLVAFGTSKKTTFELLGLQTTSNTPVALSLNPTVGDIEALSSTEIVSFHFMLGNG
jgi:hypothetical protein